MTKKKKRKKKKIFKNSSTTKPTTVFAKDKKVIRKKSFIHKKGSTNTSKSPYLPIVLFLCVLFTLLVLITTMSNPRTKQIITNYTLQQLAPPIPHTLSIVNNEETFFQIKETLFESIPETSTICQEAKSFDENNNKTITIANKFLVILKRGKLYVHNTRTGTYIMHTEVSPYPIKEDNAISYKNISFAEDTIVVTGYRAATSALEISTFALSPNGTILRKETYNLSSSPCFFSLASKDGLIFYTSKKLTSETTLETINNINVWSNTSNEFINDNIATSNVFYDNKSLLSNPLVHTFTSCNLTTAKLTECQQRHILDNELLSKVSDSNNFYFWTTQPPLKNTPNRITPNSKIYELGLTNQLAHMIQVEGIPISLDAMLLNERSLLTTIYQNNNIAPSWHTTFTESTMSNSDINLQHFTAAGAFINTADDYPLYLSTKHHQNNSLVTSTIHNQGLITQDTTTSTIQLSNINENAFIDIDGKILATTVIPDTKLLLVLHIKDANLVVQLIDTLSYEKITDLIIQEDVSTDISIALKTLNYFNINNISFISIPTLTKKSEIGTVYLLSLSNNTLQKNYTIPFKKNIQRVTDSCQNDCQEDWTITNNFFTTESLTNENFIYSITGSVLKKFKLTEDNKLVLLKTSNYTFKPLTPRQRALRIAKKPVSAKIINGKYVCKKKAKDEYIGVSKKNNKGYIHLDLECCLDPDEFPNPWCTYRPGELSRTKYTYSDYTHAGKRIYK